jgi:hypothetical protein
MLKRKEPLYKKILNTLDPGGSLYLCALDRMEDARNAMGTQTQKFEQGDDLVAVNKKLIKMLEKMDKDKSTDGRALLLLRSNTYIFLELGSASYLRQVQARYYHDLDHPTIALVFSLSIDDFARLYTNDKKEIDTIALLCEFKHAQEAADTIPRMLAAMRHNAANLEAIPPEFLSPIL